MLRADAERRDGMTKQTHAALAKEARKKRREYLLRKAGASALLIVAGAILYFGMGLNLHLYILHTAEWAAPITCWIAVAALAGLILSSLWLGRVALITIKELPYVPPLRAQVVDLHAPEILVRGSDQPAATPEELLRAAQAGTGEAAEELLRAEHGAPGTPETR